MIIVLSSREASASFVFLSFSVELELPLPKSTSNEVIELLSVSVKTPEVASAPGLTVIETVAVLVPPLLSVIVYVKESGPT